MAGPVGIADGPRADGFTRRIRLRDGAIATKNELAPFGKNDLAAPETTLSSGRPSVRFALRHLRALGRRRSRLRLLHLRWMLGGLVAHDRPPNVRTRQMKPACGIESNGPAGSRTAGRAQVPLSGRLARSLPVSLSTCEAAQQLVVDHAVRGHRGSSVDRSLAGHRREPAARLLDDHQRRRPIPRMRAGLQHRLC
jgi:hypothetical protein